MAWLARGDFSSETFSPIPYLNVTVHVILHDGESARSK